MKTTVRESQLMELVGQGLSNKEIAHRCNITEGTVKEYLFHIFWKWGVINRTELALIATGLRDEELTLP